MAIKIRDLVKALQKKPNQDDEVEAVIVGTNGAVEVLFIENSAHDLASILKLFKKK